MNDLLVFEIKNLVVDYISKVEEMVKLKDVSIHFKKSLIAIAKEYAILVTELDDPRIAYNKDILMQMKTSLLSSISDFDDFINDIKGERVYS